MVNRWLSRVSITGRVFEPELNCTCRQLLIGMQSLVGARLNRTILDSPDPVHDGRTRSLRAVAAYSLGGPSRSGVVVNNVSRSLLHPDICVLWRSAEVKFDFLPLDA
jgi:hypothetical protein